MSGPTKKDKQLIPSMPLMVWSDLWPAAVHPSAKGWTEHLPPGMSVLLDETGEEAAQWMPVLTGHTVPGRGRVQCLGVCSQADTRAYQQQVFWHNPRIPLGSRESTAQQWVDTVQAQWSSTWNEAQWQAHCLGFELQAHLDKPLWHLSTGTLRKLGIAAGLASGARVTVIEEPIAALDSNSIRYLCQALDALGEHMAGDPASPRWVIVAHWEPLTGVTWDEVLVPPSLAQACTQMQLEDQAADCQSAYVQQVLL